MNKLLKGFALILSIIFLINGAESKEVSAKKTDSKARQEKKHGMDRLAQLSKNQSWIKLSALWKELNHLRRSFFESRNWQAFNKQKPDVEQVNKYLNELKTAKLISETEKNGLKVLFDERFHYLEFKVGLIKCYKMSQLGMQIVKSRDDLETRYDILEKMYKSNKINTETYTKAKAKIAEDLEFIDKNNSRDGKTPSTKDLVELISYLNK